MQQGATWKGRLAITRGLTTYQLDVLYGVKMRWPTGNPAFGLALIGSLSGRSPAWCAPTPRRGFYL